MQAINEAPATSSVGWVYKVEKRSKPALQYLQMTGTRSNGYERNRGQLTHAVYLGAALCGAEPGRRSDWSDWQHPHATCLRCERAAAKLGLAILTAEADR